MTHHAPRRAAAWQARLARSFRIDRGKARDTTRVALQTLAAAAATMG